MNRRLSRYKRIKIGNIIRTSTKNLFRELFLYTYQYNTGSHRRPRFHGSFDSKFLDGHGSTNFCSQSDLSTSSKALRAIHWSCAIFVFIAHHLRSNDDSPFTSVIFLCFWGCNSFDPIFSGASVVEVVLELRKYYFLRNFWCMKFDEWFTYDSWFIFRIYHGDEKIETQYTREPQLSANSRADRKRAKKDVVHRMVITSLESKTRGDV